jgi:hypothetical protein
MKQILIEKYIEPSEVQLVGKVVVKRWLNRNLERHSTMGQPSVVEYAYIIENSKFSAIERITQSWHKKDIKHREKNLPAVIWHVYGCEMSKLWYKNGILIKKE